MCILYVCRAEEGTGFPITGMAGSFGTATWMLESNLSPMEEWPVLLIRQPSLQSLNFIFSESFLEALSLQIDSWWNASS